MRTGSSSSTVGEGRSLLSDFGQFYNSQVATLPLVDRNLCLVDCKRFQRVRPIGLIWPHRSRIVCGRWLSWGGRDSQEDRRGV